MNQLPYTLTDLPDFGDLMTIEEFKGHVESGMFIDYDGTGYYATSTQESDLYARPSDIRAGIIDNRFTHIAWYNK